MMSSVSESVPSSSNKLAAASKLTYKTFLSHEGAEKRTVVDLLRKELRRHGISDEKVFYDDYMKRGGNKDEILERRLKIGLLGSEMLIVFLTPDFLMKKWPFWELKTYLEMMEEDGRRKILPVFYRISAGECRDVFKQSMSEKLRKKLGLNGNSEELRLVLGKVKEQVGIDAEGLHLSDTDVVNKIMKDVFDIDIQNKGATATIEPELHNLATCSDPLCDYFPCAESIRSSLCKKFAPPPLPNHTRLDFENPKRPEKMLRDKLLSKASTAVAAVGVKGMGGVGKSTCLIGVVNDCQVVEAFPDGVLWIQLSVNTEDKELQGILVNILRYARYHWKAQISEAALNPRASLDDVVSSTGEALKEKRCVIVLDDFWAFKGYEIFVGRFVEILSPSSRILLSTRRGEVIKRFSADGISVGDLDDKTASGLFDDWCGWKPENEEEGDLKKEILRLCSNVALAVCIAGSNVRRIAEAGGKKHGLTRVLGNLRGNLANLQKLDHISEDRKLHAVMQTSVDSIVDEGHRSGYQCLAVFDSETRIPNRALEALWGTDAANVEDRVDLYVDCSLATRKIHAKSEPTNSFLVEFHDQHLEYAKYKCRRANYLLSPARRVRYSEEEEEVTKLHAQLVDGYESMCIDASSRTWWETELLDDGYFHKNYARHLAKSGRMRDLLELLMDYRWIAIRCRRQEVTGLLEDLELAISVLGNGQIRKSLKREQSSFDERYLEANEFIAVADTGTTRDIEFEALRLVQGAVRACQDVLWERSDEISFQLVGRLQFHSTRNVYIERLIDGARQWERRVWLCPLAQCFECPVSGGPCVLHPGSAVTSVAIYVEKSNFVACGTSDGRVCLWDRSTRRSMWSRKSHEGEVSSLAVMKDGSIVVSGSADKTVRLWNVHSGECDGVLRGHTCVVTSVAATKSESIMVSGSVDKTARWWNMDGSTWRNVPLGHEHPVTSVAVTEDGSVVVSGSTDSAVRLWDVESRTCMSVLSGHGLSVSSVGVGENGCLVVSGSDDKTVRLWDVKHRECKSVLRGHESLVRSVAVTEDGSVVVSGSDDNTVRLWNVEGGECNSVLRGHGGWVKSVAVAQDGSIALSGSDDNTVRLWDVKDGEHRSALRGHDGWVVSVAATEDGSVVVSGSNDDTVRLWNVEDGGCKSVLRGHKSLVSSVAVSEDGSVVVSGSADKTVRLWGVENRECKTVLQGHESFVSSVAVTEDGCVVVSGSADKTVRLWDVANGICKSVLRGHVDGVESVAVTKDGSFVVSGSGDKTVRLWNVEDGECKGVLRGHESLVNSVAVAEDISVVVSGSWNRVLRLWNMENGECTSVLRGHEGLANSLAMGANGSVAIPGWTDTIVRLWDVESGECVKTVSWGGSYRVAFGGRDLLRWARLIGLLPARRDTALGTLGEPSDIVANSTKTESGTVKIMRRGSDTTVTSATFDSIVFFTPVVDLIRRRIVVITGRHVFTLEVMNQDQTEKEFESLDEEGGQGN